MPARVIIVKQFIVRQYLVGEDLVMRSSEKKRPEDYPQFAFRIAADEKKKLMAKLDRMLRARKAATVPGDFLPKKNEIIVEALQLGIAVLEKRDGLGRRQRAP